MTLHPAGAVSSAANPLVSIVWFGKNRLQWVEKEVGSILKQSHVNWQLVVEDGGSTDGTLECFHNLAERDRRVVVASAAASGPGEALLRALRRCKGEYVAFCPRHGGFVANALEFAALPDIWMGKLVHGGPWGFFHGYGRYRDFSRIVPLVDRLDAVVFAEDARPSLEMLLGRRFSHKLGWPSSTPDDGRRGRTGEHIRQANPQLDE